MCLSDSTHPSIYHPPQPPPTSPPPTHERTRSGPTLQQTRIGEFCLPAKYHWKMVDEVGITFPDFDEPTISAPSVLERWLFSPRQSEWICLWQLYDIFASLQQHHTPIPLWSLTAVFQSPSRPPLSNVVS